QSEKKAPKGKKKLTTRQRVIRIIIIVVACLAALAIAAVSFLYIFLDTSIQHGSELDESNLGINEQLPEVDVTNIALFGLDDRDSSTDGRSDAIIILSIDRVHNQIKMTSIGRDTLVHVEGYPSYQNKTKITHAFSYGGVNAAVKALNENFGMNIKDYVFVNFMEFAEIIDYLGGVTINVEKKVLTELNNHIYWLGQECGMKVEKVKSAGEQCLTGGQALAYARVRKVDSDVARGNRQKEVLQAMFNEVKTLPMSKFPALVNKILGICHTNMTSTEMIDIASWALTASPEMQNYSLPNDQCNAWGGTHPKYAWIYAYDLEYATALLQDFVYETDTAAQMSPVRYYLSGDTLVTKKPASTTTTTGSATATENKTTGTTAGTTTAKTTAVTRSTTTVRTTTTTTIRTTPVAVPTETTTAATTTTTESTTTTTEMTTTTTTSEVSEDEVSTPVESEPEHSEPAVSDDEPAVSDVSVPEESASDEAPENSQPGEDTP
ncbi:MAG: LCP family protein, partial [Clostridia bacterium]|nr:LCP family protein [Clostridia bacterium]